MEREELGEIGAVPPPASGPAWSNQLFLGGINIKK